MPFRSASRHALTGILIASLLQVPGFAWRPPSDFPADPGTGAFDARAFLEIANTSQPVAAGRPQIYLVYAVDVPVPPLGPPAINVAPDWFDEFVKELLTAPPATTGTTRREPPPRGPVEPPKPFCNVPCVPLPPRAEPPVRVPNEPPRSCFPSCAPRGSSVLDEIESADAHFRSLPSVTGLTGMPDSLPFEANPNDSVPVERSMGVAIKDALQEAGFENPDNNGSTTFTRGSGTVTYEGEFKDGDIIVTGRLVDGRIVLTKEFKPLTGSGEAGEPVRIRSTAPTTPATPPVQATTPAYNTALRQQLEAKAATVTRDADDPPATSSPVLGQIHTRDTYVRQMNTMAERLETLLKTPGMLDSVVQNLRQGATAVDNAYQNMLGAERDVATLQGQNPRIDLKGTYEADMRRAQALESQGDVAGAEKIRQAARNTAYGNYVERRSTFFQTLDQAPLLGLGERNMVAPDDFLFKALRNKLAWNAPNSDYVTLTRPYLERAAAEARAEAQRAAAVNTVDGLNEFGGPKYERTRGASTLEGRASGSELPRLLGEAAQGGFESVEGGSALRTEFTNFGLNIVAGGAWIIPGIGPFIAGGAAAIQVVREGNELVVAVLDAEDARNLAGVTGYTRVITAEDRVAAERGEFVVSLGGVALEGLNAVRIVRGRVGSATPEGAAAAAAADPATAKTLLEPPPSGGTRAGAAPSTTGRAPAGSAVTTTGRSSGAIDDTVRQAREQARRHGIDQGRIDEAVPHARGESADAKRFADQPQNAMVEANNFLSNMAELDDIAAGAVKRGVPKADVDAAVQRAVAAANRGDFSAFDDLRGNLRTMEANARGDVVFMDPSSARVYSRVSPDVPLVNVVNTNADNLIRLDTRVAAKANGHLDELTPGEIQTLRELEAFGDDIYKWRAFDNGVDLDPVFRPGFRDRVRKAFPDGLPPVPPGTAAHAPMPARPGSVSSTAGAADDSVTRTDLGRPANPAPDDTKTVIPGRRGAGQSAIDPDKTTLIPPPATARMVEDVTQRMSAAQQQGMQPQAFAKTIRAGLDHAGISPQSFAQALTQRMTALRSPRPIAMADLGAASGAASQDVTVSLEALGVSSGTAFTVNATNRANLPVVIRGEGIVVEPVPGAPLRRAAVPSSAPGAASQDVEAFCLERLRPVATEGMAYRVAAPAVQAQHRGLVDILHAAKRVASQLRPDSEARGYFNFVRQWAIWSRQDNFDEKRFTLEFVNQTKKNVEGQGMKWTREMENVTRQAAPNRWQDISTILNEANAPKVP